jgi:phosphate-selective porin OprO/OprP
MRTPLIPLISAALLSLPATAQEAPPTDSAPATAQTSVELLLQRLEEQEQRIRILERKLELAAEAQTAATASTPVVAASPRGFNFRSPDSANSIRLRGVIHTDSRYFFDDAAPDGSNGWLLRRVRPTLEGTVGGLFDFRFTPDFAGGRTVIQDAYVTHKFKPEFVVQVGKFKTPFGLERLQSASDLRFLERSLANNLVPNRDLGLQIGGDIAGGKLSYSVAWLNGVNDGQSSENNPTADAETNNDKDIALRIASTPFRDSDNFALQNLTVALAGTYADSVGAAGRTLLPGQYRSPGQQSIFAYRTIAGSPTIADGERIRWSPQFHYAFRNYSLLGEYVAVSQGVSRTIGTARRAATLNHNGWQLQCGWFVTGEDQSFRSPTIKSPYAKGAGGWGAVELTARVSELSLDDETFAGAAASFADPAAAVRNASAWAIGVNWYLTPNVKWLLNYERTEYEGGTASGADRPDEEVLLSRFQIAF